MLSLCDAGFFDRSSFTSLDDHGVFDIVSGDLDEHQKLERTTRHDVTAFLKVLEGKAERAGLSKEARFIHYGLTSSDIVDTAFSILIADSAEVILKKSKDLINSFLNKTAQYAGQQCFGRTHGMRAEATTVGMFFGGHLAEFIRTETKFKLAVSNAKYGKMSGAVGTCPHFPLEVESQSLSRLGLFVEDIPTQIIPRDRYADVIISMASYATAIERFAVNIRHLHRSEVGDMQESFAAGQTGSSAMPHKKNPISSEQLCGLSRLMRSYINVALENCVVWHERDISHSSSERIVFPDAFHVMSSMLDTCDSVVRNLSVNVEKMEREVGSSDDILSEHAMLELIKENGITRTEAWSTVHETVGGKLGNADVKRHYLSGSHPGLVENAIIRVSKFLSRMRSI
jgi:adenylosuccinate lyase